MKKRLHCLAWALIFLLSAFCLTGCGRKIEVDIDLKAIVEANKTEEILKHYDSFLIEAQDGDRKVAYYANSELIFESSSAYTVSGYTYKEYHEIIAKDYYCGISEGEYYSIVHAGGEIDTSFTEYLMINPELLLFETVKSSREENGKIIFTTKLTEKTMVELGYWSDGPYDKCYYETEYTMDKDTLVITGIKEKFVDKKNKMTNELVYVMTTNTDLPERAASIYHHANNPEATCTATIVFDPNTENETSESFTVPKDDTVYFYWKDTAYNKVYKNRECTAVLENSHVSLKATEDVSIYLVKSEK